MISSIWSCQTSSSVCCPMMMSHGTGQHQHMCRRDHTRRGWGGDMEPVCPDQAHIAQGQVVTSTTDNVCRYNPTLHCTALFYCSTKPLVLSFEVPNKKVIRINHVWLSGASAEGGRNSGQDVGVRCVCFRYYTAPIHFRNAEECEDSALSRGCRGSQGRARHCFVLTSSGQGRRRRNSKQSGSERRR